MYKYGTVLELKKNSAIIISDGFIYNYVKKRPGMVLGQKIMFCSDDIIKSKSVILKYSAVAACFTLLVLAALLSFLKLSDNSGTFAYVYLDINPSVELTIDKDNIVLDTKAVNSDAEVVLKDLDIKGMELKETVKVILEKSVQFGFIKDKTDNYVLISAAINTKNKFYKKNKGLEETEFQNLLNTLKGISGEKGHKRIITEVIKTNSEDREQALQNQISPGKYYLYSLAKEKGIDLTISKVRDSSITDILKIINTSIYPNKSATSKAGTTDLTNNEDKVQTGNNGKTSSNGKTLPSKKLENENKLKETPDNLFDVVHEIEREVSDKSSQTDPSKDKSNVGPADQTDIAQQPGQESQTAPSIPAEESAQPSQSTQSSESTQPGENSQPAKSTQTGDGTQPGQANPPEPSQPTESAGVVEAPSPAVISVDGFPNTGEYQVSISIGAGSNATAIKLYENDSVILSTENNSESTIYKNFTGKENGSYTYICELSNSAGKSMSNAITVVVQKKKQASEVWEEGVSYSIGDVTEYKNEKYKCIQAHNSQSDWTPDQVPSLWQKQSSSEAKDSWQPGTSYRVGDIVIYNDSKYSCLQSHTSMEGWEPPNVPALWEKQ